MTGSAVPGGMRDIDVAGECGAADRGAERSEAGSPGSTGSPAKGDHASAEAAGGRAAMLFCILADAGTAAGTRVAAALASRFIGPTKGAVVRAPEDIVIGARVAECAGAVSASVVVRGAFGNDHSMGAGNGRADEACALVPVVGAARLERIDAAALDIRRTPASGDGALPRAVGRAGAAATPTGLTTCGRTGSVGLESVAVGRDAVLGDGARLGAGLAFGVSRAVGHAFATAAARVAAVAGVAVADTGRPGDAPYSTV